MTKPTFHIVALVGPAGSGKSTAAKVLVEKYGFQRLSFAGPLKEMVRLALDFTKEQVYGDFTAKEAIDVRYNRSPRFFLQRIGTEGARAVLGENVWIDALCKAIFSHPGGSFVIDDMRFLNEAARIFNLTNYVTQHLTPHVHPDNVYTAIFRLAGVEQSQVDMTHASEMEAGSINPAWIREVVSVPLSPGGQLLKDAFEASFLSWVKGLPGTHVSHYEESPLARALRENGAVKS